MGGGLGQEQFLDDEQVELAQVLGPGAALCGGVGAHDEQGFDVVAGGVEHLRVGLARRVGQVAAPQPVQALLGLLVIERGVARQAVGQDAHVAAALAVGVEAGIGQTLGVAGDQGEVAQPVAYSGAMCAACRHRPIED